MPHTDSAWKRLRQNEKRRKQNRVSAKKVKIARRGVEGEIKTGDPAKLEAGYKATQSILDRAATKGYIHPNKAARLKSRLVKRFRAAAAAPAKTPH